MSEIQRYHFPDYDYEQPFVTEADHEAAVERALADERAKMVARLEAVLESEHNTDSQDWYFDEGLRTAINVIKGMGDSNE